MKKKTTIASFDTRIPVHPLHQNGTSKTAPLYTNDRTRGRWALLPYREQGEGGPEGAGTPKNERARRQVKTRPV